MKMLQCCPTWHHWKIWWMILQHKRLAYYRMVTAMFMGCTFNAMNIIGEKEDGISLQSFTYHKENVCHSKNLFGLYRRYSIHILNSLRLHENCWQPNYTVICCFIYVPVKCDFLWFDELIDRNRSKYGNQSYYTVCSLYCVASLVFIHRS